MTVVRRLAPALLGVALAVLALGPALGPGFVLRYDMVFVPDPPILPDTGGFPRAVPSDLVMALLSRVVPAQLVQKAVLVGIFVLAATGAAALVPKGTLAKLAAAAFYGWNIYLAQRLLLGQWALLLGVAALPWAIKALAPGSGRAAWWWLPLALLPAAVGGFQAMLVSALALLPVAAFVRRLPAALLWLALLSLPWLVPALAAQAVTDPVGVDAFAARADGPFGVLGSLLAGGGIWNAEAGVPGQDDWWQATARLLLAVAGLAGFVRLGRSKERPAWWTGLAVASAAGLVIAALGPLVLEQLIALWPGFGPLRDGQVYVAPMVLAVAVGLSSLPVPRPLVIVAPLLVLPTFALGAFGRLDAVRYPGDWRAVQRIVNEDSAPGALLTLPWSAYRAHAWNEHRVILDPATKLFDRRVVWNDGLRIGMADGRVLVLDVEDPLARKVGEQLGRNVLDESTIRYVLLPASENTFLTDDPAWRPVFQGRELLLLRR